MVLEKTNLPIGTTDTSFIRGNEKHKKDSRHLFRSSGSSRCKAIDLDKRRAEFHDLIRRHEQNRFIVTTYAEEGLKLLDAEKTVIFMGPPGAGKTVNAVQVALCLVRRGMVPIFLYRLDELEFVPGIMLENSFIFLESFSRNLGILTLDLIESLNLFRISKKGLVIFTDEQIHFEVLSNLHLEMLSIGPKNIIHLDLLDERGIGVRKNIFEHVCRDAEFEWVLDDIVQNSSDIGFPLLCNYFSSSEFNLNIFEMKFSSLVEIIHENHTSYDRERRIAYTGMVYLLHNNDMLSDPLDVTKLEAVTHNLMATEHFDLPFLHRCMKDHLGDILSFGEVCSFKHELYRAAALLSYIELNPSFLISEAKQTELLDLVELEKELTLHTFSPTRNVLKSENFAILLQRLKDEVLCDNLQYGCYWCILTHCEFVEFMFSNLSQSVDVCTNYISDECVREELIRESFLHCNSVVLNFLLDHHPQLIPNDWIHLLRQSNRYLIKQLPVETFERLLNKSNQIPPEEAEDLLYIASELDNNNLLYSICKRHTIGSRCQIELRFTMESICMMSGEDISLSSSMKWMKEVWSETNSLYHSYGFFLYPYAMLLSICPSSISGISEEIRNLNTSEISFDIFSNLTSSVMTAENAVLVSAIDLSLFVSTPTNVKAIFTFVDNRFKIDRESFANFIIQCANSQYIEEFNLDTHTFMRNVTSLIASIDLYHVELKLHFITFLCSSDIDDNGTHMWVFDISQQHVSSARKKSVMKDALYYDKGDMFSRVVKIFGFPTASVYDELLQDSVRDGAFNCLPYLLEERKRNLKLIDQVQRMISPVLSVVTTCIDKKSFKRLVDQILSSTNIDLPLKEKLLSICVVRKWNDLLQSYLSLFETDLRNFSRKSTLMKLSALCGVSKPFLAISKSPRARTLRQARRKYTKHFNFSLTIHFTELQMTDCKRILDSILRDCSVFSGSSQSIYKGKLEDIIRLNEEDFSSDVTLEEFTTTNDLLHLALLGLSNRYVRVFLTPTIPYFLVIKDTISVKQFSVIINTLLNTGTINTQDIYEKLGFEEFTLAHYAVLYKSEELIQIVGNNCPDLIWERGHFDISPFHLAALTGQWRMFNRLISIETKWNDILSHATTRGQTVAHLLKIGQRGDPRIFDFLQPHNVYAAYKHVHVEDFEILHSLISSRRCR